MIRNVITVTPSMPSEAVDLQLRYRIQGGSVVGDAGQRVESILTCWKEWNGRCAHVKS
jgi:hypothetical protein